MQSPTTASVSPSASARVDRGGRARWLRRRATSRHRCRYEDAAGRRIADAETLARIKALAIPPAWTDVRIAPSPRAKLQAVGVDAAGRMQYLYHTAFRERRARMKYARVEGFGAALAALRRATNRHLGEPSAGPTGCTRDRVLAVVVRLLNDLYFRVGSEKSATRYRTFGVTTLRNRHLAIGRGGRLTFRFVGKHHVPCRRLLVDAELAAVLRDLKAVGGARLFNYLDDAGRVHAVTSRDVNQYIKTHAGGDYSAKDFRTWGATLLAAVALAEAGPATSATDATRKMAAAVRRVAERLGNTPAVCRASYIHPAVFERYREGLTLDRFRPRGERRILKRSPEYEVEEVALLGLLRGTAGARAARAA